MDDSELAKAARAGDRTAFGQLVERHYDTAYRVALRYTGVRADAEDIAQEVCLALADKIRTFKGKSRFSTWLYRVVVNACRDFARRQSTARTLQENYAVYREMASADTADDKNRTEWLNNALEALEPALRETTILVIGEELGHAEAAEILGCAESTVSWRLHEVRKKLKTLLEEEAR